MARPRILLVDDDPHRLGAMARALGSEVDLTVARSGREALALAHQEAPALMVLDAEALGSDGLTFCEQLHGDPRSADLPVIFVTPRADARAEQEAFARGASDVVARPMSPGVLEARIRSALRGRDAPRPEVEPGSPPSVLIVDDDVANIELVHRVLAPLEGRCRYATSGEDALALLAQHRFDVVVLDVEMTGLDGFAVLSAIRARPELAQLPVVFLTRHDDAETEARALDMGGVDFVRKPYPASVLLARVRNVLRTGARHERALRDERAHWQRIGADRVAQIVAVASDGIVSADAAGHVVLINEAACQLLETSPERAIGQRVSTVLERVRGALGEAAEAQCELTTSRGERVNLEVTQSVSGVDEWRLTTTFLRNRTEKERAEEALRRRLEAETASRTKSLMLSYMAHEMSSPLGVVLGFAELMERDGRDALPPVQAERLSNIATAASALRRLMRDVLDVNRFEAGKFTFCIERVDAAECLARALTLVGNVAKEAGVELVSPHIDLHPQVLADAARLEQCVVNLLTNAIKYNRPGGRVFVQLADEGDEVRIRVLDEGPGLDAEQLAQLFEPFNRLGKKGYGYGVGLVLTRLLVTGMGGAIGVESEPGVGSTFSLRLPVAAGNP